MANIILAKDQTAHTDLFEINLIWCLGEIISKKGDLNNRKGFQGEDLGKIIFGKRSDC